ncbi:RING-H2 finger protein ATL56-like [Populus nigra]|nr:RING-H2 finger protein ATL56-like [Populus nigra]XP_061964581.1 RING-H2 finger protein ATL56-like [Populus nigra]XP_061964582.1 RING-H2 finger protein ATL56-like [Populus nigra]
MNSKQALLLVKKKLLHLTISFAYIHSLPSVTMPPPHRHHDHHRTHGGATPPKPNQKLLSLILKTIIMTAITTLFFLFLGIAAILLLIATAALHRHSTPSSNSSNGLSLKDLKKLPIFRFSTQTRPETGANQTSCVVCLEEIKQGQWCRNLVGCGHVFHRKCVDAWLVKVSACPICRTQVELVHGVKDSPLWDFDWTNELRVW